MRCICGTSAQWELSAVLREVFTVLEKYSVLKDMLAVLWEYGNAWSIL